MKVRKEIDPAGMGSCSAVRCSGSRSSYGQSAGRPELRSPRHGSGHSETDLDQGQTTPSVVQSGHVETHPCFGGQSVPDQPRVSDEIRGLAPHAAGEFFRFYRAAIRPRYR